MCIRDSFTISSRSSCWLRLCNMLVSVSYTHLRAHETTLHLVCRLLLEKTCQRLSLLDSF
ncbi:hypothetical protein [Staphylococcus aureus]